MDWTTFAVVFGTVFVAEMGDKTQLATLLFAARPDQRPWVVFLAASLALVGTTAIGVLAGALAGRLLDPRTLGVAAGVGFIVIGVLTLVGALRGG